MNHFMLPDEGARGLSIDVAFNDAATRYGCFAMEHLINAVLSAGGWRSRLKMKLAGGAEMFGQNVRVGQSNIAFVRRYLEIEGIPLVGEHVGGTDARKVVFDPSNGRVLVKRLRVLKNDTVERREWSYRKRLRDSQPDPSNVELFES